MKLKNAIITVSLLFLLLVTWCVRVQHIGVFPPPVMPASELSLENDSNLWKKGKWIDKGTFGIHQLILTGTPFERGLIAGHFVQPLLKLQEEELVSQLTRIVPSSILRYSFLVILIRWFWGIEKYFEPWMVEEMAGVAKFTSSEYDYLSDPLTRQIAYHGLHEVGQMMVDQTGDDMGCTVVALPVTGKSPSWVIGRNFDFEGGRIFDSEKIMKWVFPDRGYPFVSVIWAGMVGAVTGVNQPGVYISINAAGTTDFKRYGTPSTLIVLKALQFAKTAEEAVEIIRSAQFFITDIIMVSDRTTGKLFRIEKSPAHTEVIELTQASIVTNHLASARWKDDRINQFRRDELTSTFRLKRGEELLKTIPTGSSASQLEKAALSILRDKGRDTDGNSLHPGNRRAIDALIATHSVVYNETDHLLFVSKGPGVSGKFIGFDLEKSFHDGYPALVHELPADPLMSEELFTSVRIAAKKESEALKLIHQKKCAEAEVILSQARTHFDRSYTYASAVGDLYACKHNEQAAHEAWTKALSLSPAYPREVLALENKLKRKKP